MNLKFPPIGDDSDEAADRIISYQKEACGKEDPGRMQRFMDAEQIRFMVASKPWVGVPQGAKPSQPFYEPLRVTDQKIRLASRNEMAPLLDGAAARLIGSTSEPSVIPNKPTTVVRRAAKKAETVLEDLLTTVSWVDKLGRDAKNAVDYGTSWLLSGWENDYDDPKIGPAMVHGCKCGWSMLAANGEEQPGGGVRFTGDPAKEMDALGIGASFSQPGDQDFSKMLHDCPRCGTPLALRRALPIDGKQDVLGYDLTEETPLPKVFIEGYPDTDVFPIGGGRCKHGFMPEVTIESIVPLDWLMQRYEHAAEVEGMSLGDIEELGRWHPSGLEMWGYSGSTLSIDQKRWAAQRITIRQPFKDPKDKEKDEPDGRLMISANKVVLFNGPLMFHYKTPDGEERKVPRMRLFHFANEMQNDSVYGLSDASRLVDPQLALNAMFTQFQYDMATNGSPTIAMPQGADLEGQGDGYEEDDSQPDIPNKIIRYDGNLDAPTVIGGQVTHHDWQAFSQGIVDHMARTLGHSELDQGQSVSGAPSASAQMYIGQRLDETRKPKGQRWAERLSSLFSYCLECICAVYTDRRQFKSVDSNDNRTVRDFAGADLVGQFNVKVMVRPAHDTEAFKRQNVLELLPLGLIDVSTPAQKLRVSKILGTVDDLDPEPNQQIAAAEDEFLDYTLPDVPIPPVCKERTDNHTLHRQSHLENLRSPAGESLARFWSLHELATSGWYEEFVAVMQAEAQLKTAPLPDPVSTMDPLTGRPDLANDEAQAKAFEHERKLRDLVDSLPKPVGERIEAIQMKKLEAYPAFQAITNPDDIYDARALTVWLAHGETHGWFEQQSAITAPAATQEAQTGAA